MKTSLLHHFDQQNGRFFTFQRLKPPEPLTDGQHQPAQPSPWADSP